MTVEAPKAAPVAPSKPWAVLLKDVDLRDYRIHLADKEPKTPVELEVGPLNLNLKNFDSLNRSPFTLNLDTGVGKQGKLTASGDVSLSPVSARLKVNTKDIDLRIARPRPDRSTAHIGHPEKPRLPEVAKTGAGGSEVPARR